MRQMLLDIDLQAPQLLDTFVEGRNEELLAVLRQFESRTTQEHFAYLWGESASGKTHLLRAMSYAPDARYISAESGEADFAFTPDIRLYLLDDCDKLSPTQQVAAFSLFNHVRDNGLYMISAGGVQASALSGLNDLRSRLSWGLSYQINTLTDEEKIFVLEQSAQARGLILSKGVLPYLFTHYQRDMRFLLGVLTALDQYSLETKRTMTLPLLRELLQQELFKA